MIRAFTLFAFFAWSTHSYAQCPQLAAVGPVSAPTRCTPGAAAVLPEVEIPSPTDVVQGCHASYVSCVTDGQSKCEAIKRECLQLSSM